MVLYYNCHTKHPRKLPHVWVKWFGLMFMVVGSCLLNPFIILAQTVQFDLQPVGGNFCAPAQIKLVPTFSETPIAYYWQTGISGEESQELSPTVTYTTPGTYTVTITVLFNNVLREVSHNITVYGSPLLSLKPAKDFLCQPGDVNFNLSTNGDLKRTFWDFGDSTKQTLSGTLASLAHRFNEFGTFQVSVTGIDARGCTGFTSLVYEVKPPEAELEDSFNTGCLPVEVFFKSKITVPNGSSITNYSWDFNDGSLGVSTTNSQVSHTYNITDSFVTSLTITTTEGCTNTFRFNKLAFGSKPAIPSISVNKPVGCASETMNFIASGSSATKYYWHFDDGSLFTTQLELPTQDSVLEYEFDAIGDFAVSVSAEENGCKSDLSDSVLVSIVGVVADFAFSNTCAEKNKFSFRSTSDGNVSKLRWTFIDTTNASGQARPTFTFPEQGNFQVTMIATDNVSGCSDTTSNTIYTAIPGLMTVDSLVCLGNTVTLGVLDSYNSPRTTYTWTVGGKNYAGITTSEFSVTPANTGLFTNRVIINNGTGYCRDTLVQRSLMKIAGPVASFTAKDAVCQTEKVLVLNNSTTTFEDDTIIGWKWDFGNGATSSDKNPEAIKYAASGNYDITLETEDINGCRSLSTEKIRIFRQPLLRIVPVQPKVCQGQEVTLSALHKNQISWSPSGATSCDTCSVVTLKPMGPTEILVKATDNNGCISTDSVRLDVWYPFELPSNTLRDTSICSGSSVPLNLNITGKLINWFPAVGLSSSSIPNPVAKPEVTTAYTAVVSDSGHCFTRSANAIIEVNPIPVVDPGPDMVMPYNTPFTIKPLYSPGIAKYSWQPANLLNCANCAQPSGVATVSTIFTVNVTTDKGCKSSARIQLTLDCSENNLLMPTAFTPNNDGLNDYFYPLTRGVSLIRRFVIYNRLGELVFEKRNFKPNERTSGWNGQYKGTPQPSGSFIYFVEAECDMGNLLSTKGNFVLMH